MVRELDRQEKATRDLANLQMAAQRENERRQAAQIASLGDVGKAMTAVGLLAAAGLGLAAKAASDWESAWAGVRKTVDGSDGEIAALEAEFRSLAKTLPAAHEEIAAVAEEAGALGVARKDLVAFTKTAVDLGETTNLSASEAANGLAKLGNIMGVLPSQTDRAGAALVALGNNGASTEDEILSMALRIAGAGKTIGLTEAEVLGFASALSSVGIEAEAGGSSISRVMVDISAAVDEGGTKLETFAQVAGVSTETFAARFRDDAAGAVTLFIDGLGRMQTQGESVFGVLDELGLSEIRVRDTLLRSAGASDMLTASLDLGSRAWEENMALVEEANKRYETSEARIQVARNQLNDAAIDIGGTVLPAIAGAAERVGFLAEAWQSLPDGVKQSLVVLGSAVAVIGTIGGAALMAIPKLGAMNATLAATGPAGAKAAGGLRAAGAAMMGPWGLAIAAAAVGMTVWAESQYKAEQRIQELTDTLDAQTGAVTGNSKAWMADQLAKEGILEQAEMLGINLSTLTDAMLGESTALETVNAALAAAEAGHNAMAGELVNTGAGSREYNQALKGVSQALDGNNESLATARGELDRKREAMGADADATAAATGETEGFTDALGQTAGEAAAAREEVDKLIQSIESYGEVVAEARDANRAYEGSLDDATDSLAKTREAMVAARLEQQGFGTGEDQKEATDRAIESAEAWADAQIEAGAALDISTDAGRRNQESLDEIAQAALNAATANFVNGESVADVTGKVMEARDEFIAMATRMGMSEKAAASLADELGLTRTNVDRLSAAVENVPKTATTKFRVDTEAALAQIAAYRRAVTSLPNTRIAFTGTLPTGGRDTSGGTTFAYGGYTGDAPVGAIVGGVHGQEFVNTADVTRQWRGLLEHMHAGGDPRSFLGMTTQPAPSITSRVTGPTSYAESYDQRLYAETMNVYANSPAELTRRARLAPYEANRSAS